MIPESLPFVVSPDHPARGILRIEGKDALDLLHRLSTADLLRLKVGDCCPTIFTTEKGRIIDYVLVGRDENAIVLLTSPGREERLKNWIEKYTIMEDVRSTVVTQQFTPTLALGQVIPAQLAEVFGALPEDHSCVFLDGGFCFVVRDFGLVWTHVFCSTSADTVSVFRSISTGQATVISSEQCEAYQILHGIPGTHEFREEFNPFELGIAHAISFTKGCYIGQEVIARLDTYKKVQRRLVRLQMDTYFHVTGPASLQSNGIDAGWMTSLSQQRVDNGYPGLGVIRNEVALGDSVTCEAGNTKAHATLVQITQFHQTTHHIL